MRRVKIYDNYKVTRLRQCDVWCNLKSCMCNWQHYSYIITATITTTTTTMSNYTSHPMCGLPVSPHLKKPLVVTVYQAPLGKSHFLLSGRHKEGRESLWKPVHNTVLLASCVCLRKWEAKTEAVPVFCTARIVPSFCTDWFRSCKEITERLSFLVYLKPSV